MPYVKNSIKVKVQQRSGFDKSHRNSGTLTPGTITPLLCDELIPNSRVSLRLNLAAQLPPLVSDTFMNCKLRVEAFFCPSRLCSASFESFFCDVPKRIYGSADGGSATAAWNDFKAALPTLVLNSSTPSSLFEPGSLLDFLGFKVKSIQSAGFSITALPLIAYHLIWQEWYRNPRVQNPAYSVRLPYTGSTSLTNANRYAYLWPSTFFTSQSSSGSSNTPYFDVTSSSLPVFSLADGVSIFSLRQRNFSDDYFTGARLNAQQGAPATVGVSIPQSGDGTFSIASLRAANSLQQFRERNNMPSSRLVDQVLARYGANLSDGVAQRPICIGSATYNIGSRGIDQTAPEGSASGSNPFSGVAAQYGRAYASGSDFIIHDFTANEPGYLFVNITLVPEVTYSSGVDQYLARYTRDGSITEMACSILQNTGDQPIQGYEVADTLAAVPGVFGFQDRFADWMYKPNSAHGKFRDGENLASFVLQRSFGSASLNSNFITIPTNYLDGVFSISSSVSGVGCWYDCLLDYKVSMPLAEWSLPSLQDPAYEHGHTVSIHRNGQIF